jgi:HEAT repeat protein
MRIPFQLLFDAKLPTNARTRCFAGAILTTLILAWSAPALAESSPTNGVDAEVVALLQELRDQPEAEKFGCTPCALASRQAHTTETPEDVRRLEIYDRFHALGSAAVPVLSRGLESALRTSNRDLTSTILWILGDLSGPRTFHDGSQHERNDISAALPALILALDDPTAQLWAAPIIGSIGQKATAAMPRLLALLDDPDAMARQNACNGLSGIAPLLTLQEELSAANPARRQFAQRAISSIRTKCNVPDFTTATEELARSADLVCKATVVADRSVTDKVFKPIKGYEVRESELRVISTLRGTPTDVIRFRYYNYRSPSSEVSDSFPTHVAKAKRLPLEARRTYLMVATQTAGDMYREVDPLLPSSSTPTVYIGPPPPRYVITSPGVLLAADAKPHSGTSLSETMWTELVGVLNSPREDDVIDALDHLEELSGGPAWSNGGREIHDFGLQDLRRSRTLTAIAPLLRAKDAQIAASAVIIFGRDSPYFFDEDVPFWLVGIGNGFITGLGPRKRPTNPLIADIGSKELLQVTTDAKSPMLRSLAIRALGRRSHAYPAAAVAVWARDPNTEVRRAAVLASADVPNHEPMINASTDASAELRRTSAWAVGFAQDPHLLPLLNKLLHDPVAEVRSAAAISLLSYPVDQSASVLKANLESEFRQRFVNALASSDPQPYLAMLAEIIDHQGSESNERQATGWNIGGTIPAGDSWRILFDFVRSRPAAELTSGKLDSSLNALERLHWFSSGEPTELYALYVSRGLVSRAKQFREKNRNGSLGDMGVFFDRVDRDPATYVH